MIWSPHYGPDDLKKDGPTALFALFMVYRMGDLFPIGEQPWDKGLVLTVLFVLAILGFRALVGRVVHWRDK